ncbi:hypothetical protein U1Q18_036394 [Sarracenia purpurea var. burkii]
MGDIHDSVFLEFQAEQIGGVTSCVYLGFDELPQQVNPVGDVKHVEAEVCDVQVNPLFGPGAGATIDEKAQDQKCQEVESQGDMENKDSEGSREDVAYEVTESGFDSSDSADWIRVKKRRNGRKSRQQEKIKIQEKTKTIKTNIQPVVSGGFHVHRQGIKLVWPQVRAQPVVHHLSTQSTGDERGEPELRLFSREAQDLGFDILLNTLWA